MQTDGVHEEDQAEFLDEGTEGRVQIEAEVGKDKAGKQGSCDAQAEPPDPDAPRASPEAATSQRTMTPWAIGWVFGISASQLSKIHFLQEQVTGEAVIGLLDFS